MRHLSSEEDQSIRHTALDRLLGEQPTSTPRTAPSFGRAFECSRWGMFIPAACRIPVNTVVKTCSSAHRCASPCCQPCSWRYSLHVSRRVLATNPRRLFALTIHADIPGSVEFARWRVAVRNLLQHRRASRWWNEVGLWCWLSADQNVRGIVSLGPVTETEFLTAFGRRWPTTIRPIEIKAVRQEIYFAIRPGVIRDLERWGARYQPIRVTIEPRRDRPGTVLRQAAGMPSPASWSEPLPILF